VCAAARPGGQRLMPNCKHAPEIFQSVREAVADGLPLPAAARSLGLSYDTVRSWLYLYKHFSISDLTETGRKARHRKRVERWCALVRGGARLQAADKACGLTVYAEKDPTLRRAMEEARVSAARKQELLFGVNHPKAVHPETFIEDVRRRLLQGQSHRTIAVALGISRGTVGDIASGRRRSRTFELSRAA
jgi:hypothetical protein